MRVLLLLLACGVPEKLPSFDLAIVDASPDLVDPGPQPHLPTMTNHGGAVLDAVEPWVFVWGGDEAAGTYVNDLYIDMFADHRFWTDLLGQYGVGPGTAKGVMTIAPSPPPMLFVGDLDSLADQLAAEVTVSDQTAIVMVIPTATVLDGAPAEAGGWHAESPGGVPYAVLLQQLTPQPGSRTVLDDLSVAASHELDEIVTHPHVNEPGGWYDDELDTLGEVADLCTPLTNYILAGPSGAMPENGEYLINKVFDNQAALNGSVAYCEPDYTGAPQIAVEALPTVLKLDGSGNGTLSLWFAASGEVGAIDWEIGATGGVSFSPMGGTNHVGDRLTVQVSAPGLDPQGAWALLYGESETVQYSHGVFWIRVQ